MSFIYYWTYLLRLLLCIWNLRHGVEILLFMHLRMITCCWNIYDVVFRWEFYENRNYACFEKMMTWHLKLFWIIYLFEWFIAFRVYGCHTRRFSQAGKWARHMASGASCLISCEKNTFRDVYAPGSPCF